MRTTLFAVNILVGLFILAIVGCPPVSGGTINYSYDTTGQVTKVEYPDGTVVTHTYDKMGNRQSRVVAGGGGSELPTVTTDNATGVTGSGATLNATVNANNHDTTVTFEYGTTTAYGTSVSASQNPVTGTVPKTVSRAITGLSPGVLYHYRAVAVSSAGTATGSDKTFMTTAGAAAPTVSTDNASGITVSGATLNATVNANNNATVVTFEYGTTTAYGTSVIASQNPVTGTVPTAVSRAITGLSPGVLYHYRAVGVSAGGTATGSDKTFMTTAGAAAPTVTTDSATGVTSSGATLNATVNANNNATNVTFEYGTTTAYGTNVSASQNPVTGTVPTAVSRAITGLNPGVLYHYRAVGVSAGGTAAGSDKTFTTTGSSTGVVINGGAAYSVNPKVTLTIAANPAATKMQLNYTPKGWGKIEAFVATKLISLPKGDGQKTVSVRYLDANGTALGESSDSIVLDTKAPTGILKINGGAKLTNSRDLSLSIVATDITSGLATLCVREDKLPCGEGEFSPYVVNKEHSLASAGDGKKTVYVTLRDQAGKASKQLKASIALDTTAPIGSIVINGDKDTTVTPVVKLKMKATKASEMQLSLDGGTTWSPWMKFSGSKTVTLPAGAGVKTVKVKFRDLAGNVSEAYEDSITLQ